MKLENALKLGWICGLETVGEAIENVCAHSINLFVYDELGKEEAELNYEIVMYDVFPEELIKDVLKDSFNFDVKLLDNELEQLLDGELNAEETT